MLEDCIVVTTTNCDSSKLFTSTGDICGPMDDNDVDSLFEGMDFVMPVLSPRESNQSSQGPGKDSSSGSPSPSVPSLNQPVSPAEHVSFPVSIADADSNIYSSQLPPATSLTQGGLSEPLDESLFSGLSLLVAENSSDDVYVPNSLLLSSQPMSVDEENLHVELDVLLERSSSMNSQEENIQYGRQGSMKRTSFDSIMAAYGDVAVIPAKGAPGSRPATTRRKKRSLKIGYGREAEEYEDDLQSKTSDRNKTGPATEATVSRGDNQVKPEATANSVHDEAGGVSQIETAVQVNQEKKLHSVAVNTLPNGRAEADAGGIPGSEAVDVKVTADVEIHKNKPGTEIGKEVKADSDRGFPGVGNAMSEKEKGCPSELSDELEFGKAACYLDKSEVNIGQVLMEERLEDIRSSIARKLKVLEQERTSGSALRKAVVQKKRLLAARVSAVSARLKELEAELDFACEDEDFEKADLLSESAKEAEKVLEVASEEFRLAEADCNAAAEELQKALDLQLAIEKAGINLLQSLKQEAEEESKKRKQDAEETAVEETAKLTAKEAALALKMSKATLELGVIEETRMELNEVINDSSAEEIKQKCALTDRRNQLSEELQQLLLIVKAKEAEIAEHDQLIAQADEKIEGIVAKFEEQKAKLEMDAQALAEVLTELQIEGQHIMEGKRGIEDLLLQAEEKSAKLLSIACAASEEAATMWQVVEIQSSAAKINLLSRKKKDELAEKELSALKEAQRMRKDVSAARTALQELNCLKEKLQQDIASSKQKITFVEKHGPELESEKRLAAGSRNFKEAARLAAEAKALVAEREAVTSDMAKTEKELQQLEEEVDTSIHAVTDMEKAISDWEKYAAMARCERLRIIAAAAREERDAAVELEDFAEAESLGAEAEASDLEADELQKLYQLQGSQFDKLSRLPLTDGDLQADSSIVQVGEGKETVADAPMSKCPDGHEQLAELPAT